MDTIQKRALVGRFLGYDITVTPRTNKRKYELLVCKGPNSYFNIVRRGIYEDDIVDPYLEWFKFHEFDTNWSLLMPVVEKISQTIIKGHEPFNSDQYVRVEIVPNGYVQISNIRDTPIFSNVSSTGSLITAIWLAVVRFIIWYNTKNNDTSRAEI